MREIRGEGTDWFKLTGQLCNSNKVLNKKALNLEAEATTGSTPDSQEEECEATEDTDSQKLDS